MPPRHPLTTRESNNACMIVDDAEQRPVAYVYFDEKPLPGTQAKWSRREAREIAEEIARPLLGLDEASLGALRKVRDELYPGEPLSAAAAHLLRDHLIGLGVLPLGEANRSRGARRTGR